MKICAAGIVLAGDRILLGKRAAARQLFPDVWDLVGGHCLESETPEQALLRELQEEIGIIPTQYSPLAVLFEPEPERNGRYTYHIYLVTEWAGIPHNNAPDEHDELAWLSLEQLAGLRLAHPDCLPLFRQAVALANG